MPIMSILSKKNIYVWNLNMSNIIGSFHTNNSMVLDILYQDEIFNFF